jgi:hypothetical protein
MKRRGSSASGCTVLAQGRTDPVLCPPMHAYPDFLTCLPYWHAVFLKGPHIGPSPARSVQYHRDVRLVGCLHPLIAVQEVSVSSWRNGGPTLSSHKCPLKPVDSANLWLGFCYIFILISSVAHVHVHLPFPPNTMASLSPCTGS